MRFAVTRRVLAAVLLGAAVMTAAPAQAQTGDFGVLVMAHGGGPQWNSSVETMLAPVARDYPLEMAFGMADAASLQDAVSRLEARGVSRIAVVRLFISGESWHERTEQILGIRPGAPARPTQAADHSAHGGHSMEFWRLNTTSSFAVSVEGLMDAREMGAVLVERAHALSQTPANESVLIIGHGPETDEENARWLQLIGARAEALNGAGYRDVHVETLREDWPEKRAASEQRIRAYVQEHSQDGNRVIVVPYRLSGFGPYARVLDGLTYVSDGRGLIPSTEVEHWVRRQAEEMRAGQFRAPQRVADAHADHGGH